MILKSEVWNRLEAVQRSPWGSDNWAADYVTNIQLKINQSLHDGEQLTRQRKKMSRPLRPGGVQKNCPLCYFFPQKTTFSCIMCTVLGNLSPFLYVYTHAVCFSWNCWNFTHFFRFWQKEPNWLILMHLHSWKSSENSRALLYFFGPNIQLYYLLTNFGPGQLSTFKESFQKRFSGIRPLRGGGTPLFR